MEANDDNFRCICRIEWECPLDNERLTPNIVYKATITSNFHDDQNRHLEASDTPFKERFRNHTRNFKHQKHEKLSF